jgi:hypothetical protein
MRPRAAWREAYGEHPAEYARLHADLCLLPSAIEEMLRWQPPVLSFRRTATADTVLGGQEVRASDKVVVYRASALRRTQLPRSLPLRHLPDDDEACAVHGIEAASLSADPGASLLAARVLIW